MLGDLRAVSVIDQESVNHVRAPPKCDSSGQGNDRVSDDR